MESNLIWQKIREAKSPKGHLGGLGDFFFFWGGGGGRGGDIKN